MKAKPFVKWVGGKGQLISQLNELLPANFHKWDDATYIEPFVGGGAMLFYMLEHYPNISHAVINDINHNLTTCYKTVRDYAEELICALKEIEHTYLSIKSEEARKEFYTNIRSRYNNGGHTPIESTTLFFFLNKTCFNGLYRVNKSGLFNVPFGRYASPLICDEETIRHDSNILKRVEILTGDFEETFSHAKGETLFYFDPPYRPISHTSNFNTYNKEAFDDNAHIRLKRYCDRIEAAGYKFMLSNSDDNTDQNKMSGYFDTLYSEYIIERVWAKRSINSVASKRGKVTEILVRNYNNDN